MDKSKKQRPKDVNQLAKSIVDQATSQTEDNTKKRPAKVRKLKVKKGS